MVTRKDYRDLIKLHEGFSRTVYIDTKGNPTVGWGHAFFNSPKPAKGTIFSEEQVIELFEDDMQTVERDYIWVEKQFTLSPLNHVRRGVMKNMLFNLGLPRFLTFEKMLKALQKRDWSSAADEMLDSKWARRDVGHRAIKLAGMMRKGD